MKKLACILVCLVGLISLSCGGGEPTQDPVALEATVAQRVFATLTASAPTETPISSATLPSPTDTPIPAPTPTATPTLAPTATATTAPQVEALQLVAQGWGQDERELGYAFLVENPNGGHGFERTRYQVAAYDEAGAVLGTDSGNIEMILPGERLGVGGRLWLDEDASVSNLEVQLLDGESVATEPIPALTVESATYNAGEYTDTVTGVITSPYNADLRNLRVSAVVYNEAGEIIGGGFTFLDFILANGSAGVEMSVRSSGDVASVELYPTVSGMTFLMQAEEMPDGASNIALTKQGFGQDGGEIGYGLLIENPNSDFAVEGSQYHVTAFAEDGRVLAVDEGYLEALLPNQTLGVGGTIYLSDDATVARIEAQVLARDFVESEPVPAFSAENVAYQPDEYFPQVTGQIVSPYGTDITDVRVSAILYDEAEEIIGAGFTYLDFVPANGRAAVEVSVTSSGAPAMVELYAAVSSLSELE